MFRFPWIYEVWDVMGLSLELEKQDCLKIFILPSGVPVTLFPSYHSFEGLKGWCLVTLRVTISETTNSWAHFLCFTLSLSQLLRSGWNGNDSPWHHHWMEGWSPLPVQWHWPWPLFCGTSPNLPALLCGGLDALLRGPWRSLHAQGHCAELPPYKHAGKHLSEFSMTRGEESN